MAVNTDRLARRVDRLQAELDDTHRRLELLAAHLDIDLDRLVTADSPSVRMRTPATWAEYEVLTQVDSGPP